MAESAVGFVLGRMSDEVKLAKELGESIIPLRDTLAYIRSFLRDADHRRREEKREVVQELVKQIREVAYDVEDVLDEYLLKVELQQRWHMGWRNFFRSMIAFVTQICTRHDLMRRIKQINTRLDRIKANKDLFNLDRTASSMSSTGRDVLGRNELKNDVVGFDKDEEKLIEQLTDPNMPQCIVISIVGMAGLGKTTLASRVYHNLKIKNHFGCRAWHSVSQAYKASDVLERILRQVTGLNRKETEDMDEQDVVDKLSEHLEKRRYLIVIDDIWDVAAWDGIKAALPEGQMGSRVLLTTRQAKVAKHANPDTPPHDLNLLGLNDSWVLFSKKAFQSAHCPENLKPLRETILAKCGGLPLAIVVLGGILRRKDLPYDVWNRVLEHLPVELQWEDRTLKILALSYDALPHHLKPCFLYFAAFPEDYTIDAQTLIRLWIAEGFIQPEHGQTMEELAEDSLKELIQRSMIMLVPIEKITDLSFADVRIHDLFLGFARSEAKEVNFLLTQGNRDVLPPPTVRRISLSSAYMGHAFQSWSTPKLRTLLCFPTDNDQLFSSHFLESKLLRVIDLQSVGGLEVLPEEIGGMAMLTYLGLRHSSIKKLPSSIGNLHNLQTLDIRETYISEVASTFWKIRTVRHVLVDDEHFRSKPEIPYRLSDLHTLWGIRSGRWINDGLMQLPNLRHLTLREIGSSEEEALLKSLEKLSSLVTLFLDGSSLPAEVFISSELRHLRTLGLQGEMNTYKLDATLMSKQTLPSLSSLILCRSRLKEDVITLIAALPDLQYLALGDGAYVETVLMCPSDGFPRLTVLILHELHDLEELEVKDGALPCLKTLRISSCENMRMLPAGLRHIMTLELLELHDMPSISTRIEKEAGEDYPKIQHVPNVIMTES